MEDNYLANTLKTHEERLKRVREIIRQTKKLETEIRRLLGEDVSAQLITAREEQEIRQTLDQKAVIAVFGERNSGKSSLINELLGRRVVPASERACTSRVVRVTYSREPYLCLLDTDGHQIDGSKRLLQGSKTSEKEDRVAVKRLVALKGTDREDASLVSQTVEIGLNYPLLEYGIQFVDSPGRNENKTLDTVVDRLVLQKSAPILLYVIDGKMCLRPADRASIQFFKEHCPGTKLFYICSKVDVDKKAKRYDVSEDELDADEEPESPMDRNKQEKVLEELRFHSLLDDDRSMDRFHALSVKAVKDAVKRGDLDDPFVLNFQKFSQKLSHCLDAHLKTTLSSTIGSLMRCHGRCFYCFSQKQEMIEREDEELAKIMKSARQSENALYADLSQLVNNNLDRVRGIVRRVVRDVKKEVVDEATYLQLERVGAYDFLLTHGDVRTKYGSDLPDEDKFFKLHALCHELRNFIINTVFRRVERDVENLLEDEVAPLMWPRVIDTMEALDNPTLKRNMESIYEFIGYESDFKEDTSKCLTNLIYSLVAAVREDLGAELQQAFAVLPMVEVAIELYKTVGGQLSHREEIADTLSGRLDADSLADSIIHACQNKMYENHDAFEKSIKHMEFFKHEVRINIKEQIGASTTKIMSKLAQLEIQNHALKFDVIRGSLQKGEILGRGQHCSVHQYKKGWGFNTPGQYVVRCITRTDPVAWEQSITALYYAYNCKRSENLIGIYGWLLPKPDTLYIVTEKAEARLDNPDIELSAKEKLRVVLDVAKGVQTIHASGFIFNNVKADTILLKQNKRAAINTCKGRFEVLRGQATNLDIQHLGELLVWLHGGKTTENTVTSSLRWSKPAGRVDDRVSSLIDRCLSRHKTITVSDIIQELQRIS